MNDPQDRPAFDTTEARDMDALLRAAAARIAPRRTFLDTYLPRMRAEVARTLAVGAPGETAGPAQRHSRHRVGRWYTIVGLATAALLVLSIGGFAAWSALRPQSVSAAEVVARAERTASGAGPAIRSYSYVVSSHFVAPPGRGGTSDVEYRYWFVAPDKLRMESYVKSSPHPDDINVLNISNGATRWEVLPAARRATRKTPLPVTPGYAGATDVRSLMQNEADHNQDVKLRGTRTVGGREAYVLDVTPQPNPNAVAPAGSVITLSIDKETYIALASETHDPQGTLIGSSTLSQLHLNEPIDPALFTLVPPAGTEVVDDTHQPVPDAASYARQLTDAAGAATFPLLTPRGVPTGLTPRAPLVTADLAALAYVPAETPDTDYSHDSPPLSLTERRTLPGDVTIPPGAEAVTIPGAEAAWYLPPRVSQTFVGSSQLVVLRGGVTVTIVNGGNTAQPAQAGGYTVTGKPLTKEQLVSVAASLTPPRP